MYFRIPTGCCWTFRNSRGRFVDRAVILVQLGQSVERATIQSNGVGIVTYFVSAR